MEFLESKYLYLGLMVFTLSYPIAQSFEHRIEYAKQWKYLFPAIAFMMAIFIPWDMWFTAQGVWWFNSNYFTGIYIGNLPFEECLFFLAVPFACVFIHEVQQYFIKKDPLERFKWIITFSMGVICLLVAVLFLDRIYTFITFLCAGVLLLVVQYFNPSWLSRFWLTYFISLFPFLLINGILTGSFIAEPLVNYNDSAIIGIRIFTIPIEDSIYNLFMLMIVIGIYSRLKSSASK